MNNEPSVMVDGDGICGCCGCEGGQHEEDCPRADDGVRVFDVHSGEMVSSDSREW